MKTTLRLLAALALVPALAVCSDSTEPGTQADVTVQDNTFNPGNFNATAGGTVTWEWAGNNPHNVTWVDASAPADSPTQTSGTYQRTFSAAGTYEYYCTIHGTPTSGMRGTVTVP